MSVNAGNNTAVNLQASITPHLTHLPPEALWKIFLFTDSPKQVFTQLPRICRRFHDTIKARSIPMMADVELISDEDEDSSSAALLQTPEPARLLPTFRKVRVTEPSASEFPLLSPEHSKLKLEESTSFGFAATGTESSSGLVIMAGRSSSASRCNSGDDDEGEGSLIYVAAERLIKIHIRAIPEKPQTLVEYMKDLLKRGTTGGTSKRQMRIVIGTVQMKGRRGNTCAELMGSFLRALHPLNITLWWWDSKLIANLPGTSATLRLPNMKADGHIQQRDLAVLATLGSSLRRLELFRPMPRQPWGLEAGSFAPLGALPELRELVVRTGRIIGSQELLVNAVIGLKRLNVLELPWSLDSRHGARVIRELPELSILKYVHVSSPDFFQCLPSFYDISLDDYFQTVTSPTPAVTLPPAPPRVHRQSSVSRHALTRLRSLGLNYMEPDAGDLAVLVEGIVRCLPHLEELAIRINMRQNESTYDFYSLPREYVERCFRRLEQRTALCNISLELGLRMWASRRSYADDLVASFQGSRLKVTLHSPVGRIG
ncbi:hypothetical protein HDU76_006750 [Blyttiomyces sp. JEL0837]|nr:hypothetical protein HDU76_006750 [Blyttiomyces sp. JEL0837]